MSNLYDKQFAAHGLISYRYKGHYGFIMIGAKDDTDAINQAKRSSSYPVSIDKLEVWKGGKYQPVEVQQ